jgi:hypothetical protein
MQQYHVNKLTDLENEKRKQHIDIESGLKVAIQTEYEKQLRAKQDELKEAQDHNETTKQQIDTHQ